MDLHSMQKCLGINPKHCHFKSSRMSQIMHDSPGHFSFRYRFADVFGLDLADVKTFLDEVPKVPKSAFSDLKDAELSDLESDSGSDRTFPVQPLSRPPLNSFSQSKSLTSSFSPLFSQPSGTTDFFNKLRDQKVKLESAYMCDVNTIKGIVRVVNLDFHKSVNIKYTMDDWVSSTDLQAAYMSGSCDGFSDKFVFTIDITSIKNQIGKKVCFCVCFNCSQNKYWDNNNGRNYTFQCFAAPSNSAVPRKSAALPVTSAVAVQPPFIFGSNFQNQQQQAKPLPSYCMSQSPTALNLDPWQRYF